MILFEKYGQHQPLNRQSERYAREVVDLSLSTLADQVGGCTALLRPLYDLIRSHVFAGKGRLWVYVRDDRPFGGGDPDRKSTRLLQSLRHLVCRLLLEKKK